jgi:YD repeat-containing protein
VKKRIVHYSAKILCVSILLTANPLFAQTSQFAYDKDGRLVRVTKANGSVINYQYDDGNNIISNDGTVSTNPFAVSDFTPKAAIVGTAITIAGSGFTNPSIAFNGIPAPITSRTDTSITVPVPTGATSGPLTVTVAGQTLTAGVFTVTATPPVFTVTDFTPKSAAMGDSITFTGTGFNNPTVAINGIPATVTASTSTSLTVAVPTGVTSGPVTVTVGGQTQTVGTFTVIATPIFTVADFTPKLGTVGSSITITGNGFNNPTVAINGIPATVTASTLTSITAAVPTGATSGPVTVTVGGQTQTVGTFTVGSVAVAPVLTTFSFPIAKPGDSLTLFGSNFDTSSASANTVKVSGLSATVTDVQSNRITFVVPPALPVNANPVGRPGTAETVTVKTLGGTSTAPNPFYSVPNISFNKPLAFGITASGTFGALGDNGLLTAPGGQARGGLYNLSINASNVTGSGALDVIVWDPDKNLSQIVTTPVFSALTGGSFQANLQISLPLSGQYLIQSFFEYDTARSFQATGTVVFGLGATPINLNAAATVYNPIPGTTPNTTVNTATSVYNPIPGSMPPTAVNTAASVYNPIPGVSPPTTVNTATSVYNPIPGVSLPTTANTAASVFNPDPSAPPVVSADTKANATASVYNPVPGTRPPTAVNTAASVYNPIPGTSSPTTVNTAASIYNPIPGASPPTAVNTAASVFNPIPGVKPPTAVNAAASVCNPGGDAVCP